MNKKFADALKYILFFGIGVLLLWLTFRNQNFSNILDKIKNVHLGWMILAIIASLFAHISRAIRWNMLIEPLGYKPKTVNTFWAVCAGYFANLAIPRLGEITRCGTLSNAEKIPFNELFGTVIVERIMDVLMLFIGLLIVTAMEFDLIGGFLNETIFHPITTKLQNLAGSKLWIVVIIAATVIYFLWKALSKTEKFKNIILKINNLIKGVVEGMISVRKLKSIPLFIFHTIWIWSMYFFASYLVFFALDSTAALGLKEGLVVLVIGGLGMTAPVQGGIGAYHWIVSHGLMLYNIPETDGIVYATLVHGYQTLLLILLGAIGMGILLMAAKKNPEINGLHTSDSK